MDDGDALIRACLKAPADQAPRLILADWLDERGDPRGPALRVSLDLSFGELPGGRQVAGSWGRHPEHRLASRLALVAYERRAAEWKIPSMYLTACELYACRLIDAKRRDAWLHGPYLKMVGTWPVMRYPETIGSSRDIRPYYRNRAAMLMRACGDCQLPFGYLAPKDRPLADAVLSAARDWIYARMFEAVKDRHGWVGYRRFIAYPHGRRVQGDRPRAYLDHNV